MADESRNVTRGGLVPLDEADDYKIAEGNPDPRGWDVVASGTKVGEVDMLIADLGAMKVRYLDVELDKQFARTEDRHVLIPVGAARLDDDNDRVLLEGMTSETLLGLPLYTEGTPITRDFENTLRERLTGAPISASRAGSDYYEHEHFDENRFFGKRARAVNVAGGTARVVERVVQIPVTDEERRAGKGTVKSDSAAERLSDEERRAP